MTAHPKFIRYPTRNQRKPFIQIAIKKRSDPVGDAIRHRTTTIGSGVTGDVYKTKFEDTDAVVKVINTESPGGRPDSVRREVINLKTVGQFLGWGEKKTERAHLIYVVMRNMGVPAEKAGLAKPELKRLMSQAKAHYKETYHIENKDQNSNNYVYRKVNGQWRAEIVDLG